MTIGNVTTVRWLNTAVTICRIYLSFHRLNTKDTKNLNLIIVFIVAYYFPMYFYIKVRTQLCCDEYQNSSDLCLPLILQCLLFIFPHLARNSCFIFHNLVSSIRAQSLISSQFLSISCLWLWSRIISQLLPCTTLFSAPLSLLLSQAVSPPSLLYSSPVTQLSSLDKIRPLSPVKYLILD